MIRQFTFDITDLDANKKIYTFLKEHHFSRQVIVELKRQAESILVNGEWVHINHVLNEGDLLKVTLREVASSEGIVPNDIPVDIIYEDEDLLVVNKPSGMPIHPSLNHYEGTLANALVSRYDLPDDNFVFRCINRLDKDTTGLTIVAKNMISGAILSNMMKTREIKREYLAIVEGIPAPLTGTINAPIARIDDSLITRCVNFEKGEHAVTHYRTLSSHVYDNKDISLVSLILETGRTHQIRVHMSHIGHPLIGDYIYNPDSNIISRQALHAHRLTFTHPITGKVMDLTAPLPEDMTTILGN